MRWLLTSFYAFGGNFWTEMINSDWSQLWNANLFLKYNSGVVVFLKNLPYHRNHLSHFDTCYQKSLWTGHLESCSLITVQLFWRIRLKCLPYKERLRCRRGRQLLQRKRLEVVVEATDGGKIDGAGFAWIPQNIRKVEFNNYSVLFVWWTFGPSDAVLVVSKPLNAVLLMTIVWHVYG